MPTCSKCGQERDTGRKVVIRDHKAGTITVAFICLECLWEQQEIEAQRKLL